MLQLETRALKEHRPLPRQLIIPIFAWIPDFESGPDHSKNTSIVPCVTAKLP